MEAIDTPISGCYEIKSNIFKDARGRFIKTFHEPEFVSLGLRTDWKEEYYSISHRNVLRGMHFQVPPVDHAKIVYCLAGEVLDVVVDLRSKSSTYRKCYSIYLSPEHGNSLYIPSGLAHGFLTLTNECVMHYKATSVYSPEHDAGVLWSSLEFEWPLKNPVVSERDKNFPAIADFETPFL